MKSDDTIAAIASGIGEAGIGVVRISGPQALEVGVRAFRSKRAGALSERSSHRMVYGWVVDGEGCVVDEALAVVMRAPHSYTGEDVVELQVHGGSVAVRRVLDVALIAGARLAEPGEFTRRGFLNGRMDLAQAEAVIEVIRAKTDRAMHAAVKQLQGGLSEEVRRIRERLMEIMAHLEADIDFPELELEVQTMNEVDVGCTWSLSQVESLLRGAKQGRLLREGFRVVLAGRPNVGKSSLLNRLVRANRAIVTEIPGTTRDVIEEWVNIRGLPVSICDTAGIRETNDLVERMGVDRSREVLEGADLIMLVIDGRDGMTKEDREILVSLPADATVVVVVNKMDLLADLSAQKLVRIDRNVRVIGVSAVTGIGLEEVEAEIAGSVGAFDPEEEMVGNARHEEALRKAAEHLKAALETRRRGFGSDLVSIDVRAAWVALGEITGESAGDDLLDQIFERFCIGK